MHATGAKRGKTRASEARLVLVLLLIDWKTGANFCNQSRSIEKQIQSKREITFDTQLETALVCYKNKHNKIKLAAETTEGHTHARQKSLRRVQLGKFHLGL